MGVSSAFKCQETRNCYGSSIIERPRAPFSSRDTEEFSRINGLSSDIPVCEPLAKLARSVPGTGLDFQKHYVAVRKSHVSQRRV